MFVESFKNNVNKKTTYLYGGVFGFFISLAIMFVFAAIILLFNIERAYSIPFATISVAVGSFFASKITSKKIGNKGYLTGLIIGLIIFVLLTIISLILGNGLSINTLFRFIIIILSSLAGGITGVNNNKMKKYI